MDISQESDSKSYKALIEEDGQHLGTDLADMDMSRASAHSYRKDSDQSFHVKILKQRTDIRETYALD